MNAPAVTADRSFADQLPPLDRCAEVTRRYAHLLAHFSSELGERPLVRQNGEFFPDRFDKDAPSVERLVRRLQTHAGMLDVPIEVRLLSLEADGSVMVSGGCGSGACAPSCAAPGTGGSASRLEETAQGWILNVLDGELHHPVALTTQLALALGEIFLAETASARSPVEEPRAASRDLTCVALGLGLIVLEGSFIYSKSCGGPSVTRLTELAAGDLAVACSLFIALGGHSGRRALSELSTTQRSLLAEANDWAASNGKLVNMLADNPGQVATRAPVVQETRSWLLRVFDRSPARKPAAVRARQATLEQALASGLADQELLELAREQAAPAGKNATGAAATPAQRRTREHDELAALVDEALRG